ncbi:hypothetical protein JD844_018810, partial [Phrynosoma platyrhinos]
WCFLLRTAHAKAKSEGAEQAAVAANSESTLARSMARELSPDFYQPGPEYLKRRLIQELMENEENMEEEAPPVEEPPALTSPGSPQDDTQDSSKPKGSAARTPSPPGTPPEAKRAKQGSQKESFSGHNGSWNGDHSKEGSHTGSRPNTPSNVLSAPVEKLVSDSRPTSQSPSRHGRTKAPAEQMEIKPLQRIHQEGDVKLFRGYHSYKVRTSPVTPPIDYEEESFPDSKLPVMPISPEPKADVNTIENKMEPQKRGGTPVSHHEPAHEEEKAHKMEVKQEPKQQPVPEHKVEEKTEAAPEGKPEQKTETKVIPKVEPKAMVKKVPPPEAASKEVEEHEEGPNTIIIFMVILLNIGLSILFVHFLT